MIRRRRICALSLLGAVVAFGGLHGLALAATDAAAVNSFTTAPHAVVDPRADGASSPRDRQATGNPLWAVPLRALSATRERPIFSPSRRPPAPVVAAPQIASPPPVAAKPAEPDHPLLSLVGTIVGENEGIGIFLEQASNKVVRLKTGQSHSGWSLRAVRGREAIFDKDKLTATLALPAPGAAPVAQPGVPVPAGTQPSLSTPIAAQPGATWMDGDGQMISPPPAQAAR
jgi:general secretion pathway protein N